MTDQAVPLIVRRVISAPCERVFQAFSRADLLSQWFTPSAEISLEVLDFDFAPKGLFRFRYIMPDGRRPVVAGAYEHIDPPKEIALTWIWEAPDPLAGIVMRVRFQFVETEGATEVTVVHEDLPSDAACSIHEDGWAAALDGLARFMAPIRQSPQEAAS